MLEKILQTKQHEMEQFTPPVPLGLRKPRSFREALVHPHRAIALIAEVKRASPSKGTFKTRIDPADIATRYERAGADAVSVLTDRTYFKGDRDDLKAVKAAVDLPVLRKDFIIDERQIEESAQIGADAILLIAAALPPKRLYTFYKLAGEMGMECLVEVHDLKELKAVLDVFQPEIIGINNRNLKTFHTTIANTLDLLPYLPPDSIIVSESGFLSHQDVSRILPYPVHGILVGEALMTAASPEDGICRLMDGDD